MAWWTRAIPIGIASGLACAVGDRLLHTRPRFKREFLAQGVEEAVMQSLQTGDIVLFNRSPLEVDHKMRVS